MHFNGLTDKQVEESRKKYGSNVIPDSEPTTFWVEFKETFKDPMIRILLAIAALMIVMCVLGYAEIYEPIGTVVAVLIVAFVSAKTGVASDTKYRQLKDSTKKDQCKVYRNGLVTVIDVDDVVVGDKVLLQSGDKVPADGVLIHGTLRVDNSALNGEAEECPKTAADESFPLPEDITGDTFVDAHSLFRGAVLFDGEGVLDVRKVGLATMMGKMAEEMQDDEPDSPLKVKLGKLADMISRFGYIGAVVIAIMYFGYFILSAGGFAAYFSSGAPVIIQDIVEAVSLAVVIIVCAVPEGLPLMISLVLMQNTSKMLDHNVLVRKAEGIETAGSLNILFSDKTGTITKGHLEVVEFFTADGVAIPLDQLAQQTKLKGLIDLAIGKNSQSMYDGSGRVVGGNATDQALMRFLGQETFHKLDEVSSYAVTKSQSFNSANKFSQAYIAGAGRTFYKGAPEKFLAVAQKYLSLDGDEHPLDLESLNAKIDELAELAPLHNKAALMGIEACEKVMPGKPQVAVFDTAFHQTMPPVAYTYALPYEYYEKDKVRRYGFHGTSHKYVSQRAADMLGKPIEQLKLISCHLGNGSSVTAIEGGKSVDTSMGFTPLAGLPMGTRSGDIDAGILEYLMNKYGMDIKEMVNVLNKKSGVMGVSGVSSDFRDLEEAFEQGNERAGLAVDMFNYGVKKLIGAYAAAMGGVDAIIFTAGVGENSASQRMAIASGLEFMGVKMDEDANKVRGEERVISAPDSKVTVLLIPTNEELMIAMDTEALVG